MFFAIGIGRQMVLAALKHYVRNRPWCMLGDFNAALFLHDYSAGHSNVDISIREFKECVEDIEVMDVHMLFLNRILRNDLDQVQTRLDLDPFNAAIRDEEALVLAAFNEAYLMEEKFLKQKAKIDWLREGDSNSAYF
nr:RNA-directed DNA polymerase, eukaryota, reverse transcriptase zinc-binding domain protein [Tanacetum cinerariifolium]